MKKPFLLRIDESLKTQIEEIAKREKRSLNQQIEKVLEDFIDNSVADSRICQKRVRVNLEDL